VCLHVVGIKTCSDHASKHPGCFQPGCCKLHGVDRRERSPVQWPYRVPIEHLFS
jgi:hypothetical protein